MQNLILKKIKIIKKFKIISLLLIIFILSSFFTYGYYTNTSKYFLDSRKSDGFGGFALERDANDFIVDGCGSGTMLDIITGLCWIKNMNTFGIHNWDNAVTDCSNLDYSGHTDWRLPTRNEFFTLTDQIGNSGSTCISLEGIGFINCRDDYYYWLKDEYVSDTGWAIFIDLSDNRDGLFDKPNLHYVTCVRRN